MVQTILFLFLQKISIYNTMENHSQPIENQTYQGDEVRLCKDGKYRWVYEMSLLRNPTIALTVFKLFFWIVLAIFVVLGLINMISGGWAGLWGTAKAGLVVLAIFAVLTLLGTLLMAAIYRGKYVVLFVMDTKGVAHIQVSRQFKKAQVAGMITFLVGCVANNPATMGAGLMSASKPASFSVFSKVRRVKACRRRNLIKVNQLLFKNQVYVADKDFDFVIDFIKSHCPNAKYR